MNLAFDPWIPCTSRNGTPLRASLCQCLSDGEIADVAVRPHERVALMRLLLCVAYAALGIPGDYAEWAACRGRLAEASTWYLEQWRDSFELFHPTRPFLQVANLRAPFKSASKKAPKDSDADTGGQTPTSKLNFSLATGNNSTLFDHEALADHRAIEPEQLALDLLTYQMFSPGGKIGRVLWNGFPMWKDKETGNGPVSSIDAPCSSSSMLHTFLRGANLQETIWLNLLSVEELQDFATPSDDWRGRPLWEAFPAGPHDKDAVHNATRTLLGRMVPLSRAILLNADRSTMLLGNGLPYPVFGNSALPYPPEPSAAIVARKAKNGTEEYAVLGLQPGKRLWRQLHALTVHRLAGGAGGCLALAHVNDNDDKGVELVVGGLARNQAAITDAMESVFHVPSPLLRTSGHAIYASEVQIAEDLERLGLAFAMERWRATLDGGWGARLKLAGGGSREERAKLRAQASRDYWTSVECNLPLLFATLDALGTDEAPLRQQAWRKMLRASALNAYSTACQGNGQRQLRAYVAGKSALLGVATKLLEIPNQENS